MEQKRILMISNSIYQLFTIIHMKLGMLENETADLIVTDIMPEPEQYQKRLLQTGLFGRVMTAKTKDFSGRYMTGSEKEISEGYGRRDSILRWALSDELGYSYKQVYFSNYDTFTRMLACRYYGQPCEFICFEDGFSTYVIDYLRDDRAAANRHPQAGRIREMVTKVYLYEPGLAMRSDRLVNAALPKIDRSDSRLKNILNAVFDYSKPEMKPDFLFLEQSFRAEGIPCNDIELMRECRNTVGSGHFAVKPHPRNPENLPYRLGLSRKYTNNAPWELFLLNEELDGLTIITVCSNAALTGRIVFGLELNTVMLYPLFDGRVLWKEDEVLRRYLRKFYCRFAGRNYYVPKTLYEMRNTLSYLQKQNAVSGESGDLQKQDPVSGEGGCHGK